jgi:hypothetical protein
MRKYVYQVNFIFPISKKMMNAVGKRYKYVWGKEEQKIEKNYYYIGG